MNRGRRNLRRWRRRSLQWLAVICVCSVTPFALVSPASAGTRLTFKWPVTTTSPGTLNSRVVAYRNIPGSVGSHSGRDMGVSTGTPVYASRAGVVTALTNDGSSGYGLALVIRHENAGQGDGTGPGVEYGQAYFTLYAHLSSTGGTYVGQPVDTATLIAYSGCTGTCFGDHLHFEINLVEVARGNSGYGVNGYSGQFAMMKINAGGPPGNGVGTCPPSAGGPRPAGYSYDCFNWDDLVPDGVNLTRGDDIPFIFAGMRGTDTLGVFQTWSGIWYERNDLHSNTGLYAFGYGDSARTASPGDFDGEGRDTAGLFANWTPVYSLRNSNDSGPPNIEFTQGDTRCKAFTGDWDGNGSSTPGFYCPEGVWYLSNGNYSTGSTWAHAFAHGGGAGDRPVVGDFNGDGSDDVAIMRESTPGGNKWYINLTKTYGYTWGPWYVGSPGDIPVAGDWDGDGFDSIGVWRPGTGEWYLKNVSDGSPYSGWILPVPVYGIGSDQPVSGDWDRR